jgi:hypothetical protein
MRGRELGTPGWKIIRSIISGTGMFVAATGLSRLKAGSDTPGTITRDGGIKVV